MNSEFQTNVLSSSSSTLFDDRPARHRVRKALLTKSAFDSQCDFERGDSRSNELVPVSEDIRS